MAAPSPVSTSPHAQAAASAMPAYRAVSRSYAHPVDAHQKERRSGALSRGHFAHDVSNTTRKGVSARPRAVLTLHPCELARRHCRVLFHAHSHWSMSLPPIGQLVAGRAFCQAAPAITNSLRVVGSSRSRAHSLTVQQQSQLVAGSVNHLSRLPNRCSLAGSNNASKSGQALGNIIRERGRFVQGTGRHD